MRKTDIERIIKQGSTRQKINLYFTDVAYFNTKGIAKAELKGSGENMRLEVKDRILTEKERVLICNSIKEPKDIKYWEELRTWNKAFLMFKPTITACTINFDCITSQFSAYAAVRLLHKAYEEAINDILEVVEDKKLREKLVNTALESLQMFGAIRYQEEGYLPFIEILGDHDDIDGKVWRLIKQFNEITKDAKEYIEAMKTILNKFLPLQPYKEFLNEEENKIKTNIEKCRKFLKALEVAQGLELPDIMRWEDVEVEITSEDIKDIKNAGR
jgi:hypothetical protein